MNDLVISIGDFTKELAELGREERKHRLGAKGLAISEMSAAGLPVPPAIVITTLACERFVDSRGRLPDGLLDEVKAEIGYIERRLCKEFGGQAAPLLVSVRPSPAVSMPAFANTILNLGLNDSTVVGLADRTKNRRFAYDAYRRLINMFGDTLMGVPHEHFEVALERIKEKYKVKDETDLSADGLVELCEEYKLLMRTHGSQEFPQDPFQQLQMAIVSAFRSWISPHAIRYREVQEITEPHGLAVIIQAMVFGNTGKDSAVGVAFTRDPKTGENAWSGEFLINAQGEDVVAGIRRPEPLSNMPQWNEEAFKQLERMRSDLEFHHRDVQDIEFTVDAGEVWLHCSRTARRTARAALRILLDFLDEGLITTTEAILRMSSAELLSILSSESLPNTVGTKPIATGLPASPGAASGAVVFDAGVAEDAGRRGENVILVCREVSPEDADAIQLSQGVVTTTGGMTSHAAVACRDWRKPCVSGVGEIALSLSKEHRAFSAAGHLVRERDNVTINGFSGEIYLGTLPLQRVDVNADPDLLRYSQLIHGVDSCDFLDDRIGTLWALRDVIAGRNLTLVGPSRRSFSRYFRRGVDREADLIGAKAEKPNQLIYKSFVQPSSAVVDEVLSNMSFELSDDTCLVAWGILDHFLRAIQSEVGIGSHPRAIRPLSDPNVSWVDSQRFKRIADPDESFQLIGVEFFGINRWLRNFLDCACLQWCAIVRVSCDTESWQLDNTNLHGESLILGSRDLVGFLLIRNGAPLTIRDSRAFYNEMRVRECDGWSWFERNDMCWREVRDIIGRIADGRSVPASQLVPLCDLGLVTHEGQLTAVGAEVCAQQTATGRRCITFFGQEQCSE